MPPTRDAPQGRSSETHFHAKIVLEQFQDRSLLNRHHLVYDLLLTELQHACAFSLHQDVLGGCSNILVLLVV